MRGAVALGLLAACGGAPAAIDARTVDAQPRQVVTDTQTLASQALVEGSWTAGPGDEIGLTLEATSGAIDYDIHGHANGGTQEVVAAFDEVTITYDFVPAADQQWFLLVRNSTMSTTTFQVHMNLYGGATWNGWQ